MTMKKKIFRGPVLMRPWVLFFISLILVAGESRGASNQFGETGLLSLSTAETVGSGNLCAGLWYDLVSLKDGSSRTIAPLSLTFGMGKNIEINASYPNILFNDDVDGSGRGFSNLGVKYRIMGTNRSSFKLALSASLLNSVSSDSSRSGLTDYEGKVLLGVKKGRTKYHLLSGYRTVDNSLDPVRDLDDEIFIGAAVDYSPHRRFRTFVEGEWRSARISGGDDSTRITPGVQIFITPHLTFSGGVDFYLSGDEQEWRVVAGISTCGGLGEYVVPIPKRPKPAIAEMEKPKTKPPIPILPEMVTARRRLIEAKALPEVPLPAEEPAAEVEELAPISRYEVQVTPGEEVVMLPPVPQVGPPGPPAVGEVPQPRKGRVVRKFRIPGLVFDFDKWTLRSESVQAIAVIASELAKYKGQFFIKIEGHTDNIGSADYNQKLSLQRSTAVAVEIIEKHKIPPDRIFIEGYGESRPIASNDTPEGRRMNRRVDILLIVPEQQGK